MSVVIYVNIYTYTHEHTRRRTHRVLPTAYKEHLAAAAARFTRNVDSVTRQVRLAVGVCDEPRPVFRPGIDEANLQVRQRNANDGGTDVPNGLNTVSAERLGEPVALDDRADGG